MSAEVRNVAAASVADDCKGCSATVRLTEEDIAILAQAALQDGARELVSEELYAARMNRCGSCSDLKYGTTCRALRLPRAD